MIKDNWAENTKIILAKIYFALVFTGCGDGVARAYDAKSATLRRIYQVA